MGEENQKIHSKMTVEQIIPIIFDQVDSRTTVCKIKRCSFQLKIRYLKLYYLYFCMQKKLKLDALTTQDPSHIFANSTLLYSLSITDPQIPHKYTNQQKKVKKGKIEVKRQRNKNKQASIVKQVDQPIYKNGNKSKSKHSRSKSGRSQSLLEYSYSREVCFGEEFVQGNNKIIINSNFLQQMRKRSSNSQMKHYRQPIKIDPQDEQPCIKKKKKKITDQAHSFRRESKNTVQIIPNYTALSQINKKQSKNTLKVNKHSSTFSAKLNKTQLRSTEMLADRRCKSSLKQKKASKLLNDLKEIGRSLPLVSKLNSLYSNTTSIYNSKSNIQNIQKFAYRIPTQEPSDQIQEIRRYESLILTDRNINLIRTTSKKSLAKSLQIEQLKTEQIINNYVQKLKIQPYTNVCISNEKPDYNHIYSQTSSNVVIRDRPKDQSIIDGLQTENKEENQFTKLNSIISIIQKNDNRLVQQDKDKIIFTIKELLQRKRDETKGQKNVQMNNQKIENKSFLSIVESQKQLKDDFSSQGDISVVNLQVLDKALRDREEYLYKRLKKEIELIEEEDKVNYSQQVDRISKWINHQIKQVRNTRINLWKGFNLAKNLLNYTQLSTRNKNIMKSLSQKYIYKNTLTRIQKQNVDKARLSQIQAKVQGLDEPRIIYTSDDDNEDQSISQVKYSPLAQHDSLHLQDLKFLSSDKYEEPQEQQLIEDEDLLLRSETKIREQSDDSIQKRLKRQRLHCQSPYSDSNQSYGAIIIERQDTFLFSSEKKSQKQHPDISLQDKEDICEFIFLDLCLEITEKVGKQSRVAKSITQFVKQSKQRSKRAKGFKTNPTSIKQYLTNFINFLKTKPQIIQQIHDTMDKPMGPTALEILKYMHTFNEDIEEEQDAYILTSNIFDMFEDTYMRSIKIEKYYDDEEREVKRRNFIKNAIHIHNKAIYDAYNQTLDKDRPFGMWGQPFSWKKSAKFAHKRDTKAKNELILKRAQQTIEYSHFMCGFILDKQDCIFKDNPQITDSYIEQVRHDRLSQLMAKELHESEQRMQFFDDEETEILVDIGHFIFMRLVIQLTTELMPLI